MSIFDPIVNLFASAVSDRVLTELGRQVLTKREYRLGRQPKQLKVADNQYDDNLTLNFTGLIADRTVSQLIGDGIKLRAENENSDTPTVQGEYLSSVWDANHQEILLHRAVLSAVEAGTGYILLNDPALGMGAVADEDGQIYPRLILVDPAFVEMEAMPEDYEIIWRYTIQYKFIGADGKERARKKVIEQDGETQAWAITTYELSSMTAGRWVEVARLDWPWPFAPIIHWQCLPTIDSPYGRPVLTEDILNLQNKINGDMSFLSQALRLGVHPLRWGKGLEGLQKIETGPDKMVSVGPMGEIAQLPPELDWQGALAFFKSIRAGLFDITRTVDIDSLQDKLGSLTNFGLRVIYQDNINKISTMRELLGDMIEELNRRLLIMAGLEPVETEVIWPEFVPVNLQDLAIYHQTLVGMGVESKQTAAEEMDLDWEQEQDRKDQEQQATDNVGSFLLRAFNRGNAPGQNQGQQQPGR